MPPSRANLKSRQQSHEPKDIFFVYAVLIGTGAFTFFLAGIHPSDPPSTEPASYLVRYNTLALSGITFWLYLRHNAIINPAIRASWPLFLIPVLGFLSCLWSVEPSITFRRTYALLNAFLFAAVAVALLPPMRLLRVMCLATGAASLLSVICVFVIPSYGVHQASDYEGPVWAGLWRGIYSHKNILGGTSGITLLLWLAFARYVINSLLLRLSIILATGACLFGASSATGIVVGTLMLSVAWVTKKLFYAPRRSRAVLFAAGIFLTVLVATIAIPLAGIVLELLGKGADLTGRVPIWSTLIFWANERPWLGFGYATFDTSMLPRYYALTGDYVAGAHNGYLETFISFGYIGLTALALVLWTFGSNLFQSLRLGFRNDWVLVPLCATFFVGSAVGNLTESMFFLHPGGHNLFFGISYVLIATSKTRAAHMRTNFAPARPVLRDRFRKLKADAGV